MNCWDLALWEAMVGHKRRSSLSCSSWPRTEIVMKGSWGLAPWKEPMRGYWWNVVAPEDSSILEIQVMQGDHQEQQQQWGGSQPEPRMLQRAELEVWSKPFGGAQKIICRSQTLEHESVGVIPTHSIIKKYI